MDRQNNMYFTIWYGVYEPESRALTYASAGNGTLNHLAPEMLKAQAGIDLVHVPYKSGGAAATDLATGRVQLIFSDLPALQSFVKNNQVRALAVTTPKRWPLLPELPAVAETVPGFEAISWFGLMVAKGTPRPIVDKINAEVRKLFAGTTEARLRGWTASRFSAVRRSFSSSSTFWNTGNPLSAREMRKLSVKPSRFRQQAKEFSRRTMYSETICATRPCAATPARTCSSRSARRDRPPRRWSTTTSSGRGAIPT